VRWLGLGCVIATCLAVATAFATAGGEQRVPTASRDILPILLDKCAGCHRAGGIAPFPLTSSGDAVAYSPEIAFVDYRKIHAAGLRPSSPEYVGQTARTHGRGAATIATWVAPPWKGGLGDAAAAARPAGLLTLQMPVAYVRAPTRNRRCHCFVLEPEAPPGDFVTSVQMSRAQRRSSIT
jgi:hypothetical protein